MRFEPRRTFASARPLERRPAARDLPADLAFVETYGVSRDDLQTAAARAVLDGTDGRRALLADGAVSEAYYYRALAWHLGVPFIDAWPRIAEPADLLDTLARGTARLVGRDRSWLIAPESAGIRTLVAARSLALTMPKIAITTPTHFAALVGHRAQARIARRASLAFPAAAPRLSAHRAVTPPVAATVVIALLALLGGIYVGSRVESDLLGLVFLAGLVFRLFVFGEGLPHAPVVEDDDIPDRVLPTYSVLVPLRDEVEMVPDLVAALAALDYPSAKREVLFLVESDDAATRTALAGQRLPAGFRIVDLPPGLPRTKPRALNVGLLLARGELVTIYDAEDRPEQNQLRRAACRFVDAPDSLACLQARLAIVNGPQGLLPNLFAIEYAGLLYELPKMPSRLRSKPVPLFDAPQAC